jgi:predicted nucleotidyltransferase
LNSILGSALVKLRLFGSRARGDADADPDVDVAIIVRENDPAMRDLIPDIVSSV